MAPTSHVHTGGWLPTIGRRIVKFAGVVENIMVACQQDSPVLKQNGVSCLVKPYWAGRVSPEMPACGCGISCARLSHRRCEREQEGEIVE